MFREDRSQSEIQERRIAFEAALATPDSVILEGQDAGITEVVASRYWAAGSRALLIAFEGPETLGGTFTQAAKSLTSAGLTVDTETVKDYSSLISQIHDWGADLV